MASILGPAAQRIKASTAGHTYVVGAEPAPGTPVAGTLTETVRRLVPTASGALDHLFRMEPVAAAPTNPAPVVATTATPGPHGGLVPAGLSHIFTGSGAPGPGPGPGLQPTHAAATAVPALAANVKSDVVASAADARVKGTHALATLRRRLGI